MRELDAFDVVVVDGFGFGFGSSDTDVTSRSIENITSEIHEIFAKLNVT